MNHKQTFRQEFDGEYVWCPKRKQNGATNHFYETMREVRPGDIVFSYANGAVQGFGFAKTHCYSCPRPNEFGSVGNAWDVTGWRVDVGFHPIQTPFRVMDHAEKVAPLLPSRYSPIQANGYGNQGAYFAEISEAMALRIAELADPVLKGVLNNSAVMSVNDLVEVELPSLFEWEEHEQERIRQTEEVPDTTRNALISARRGQGQFKINVGRFERSCRVTGVDNPAHLIASHIKPWRESNNEERLHGSNGLLLTPTIDHLFDRGFITFSDDGELISSPIADKISLKRMGIETQKKLCVGTFNSDQRFFLDYHRKEIFLQSAS